MKTILKKILIIISIIWMYLLIGLGLSKMYYLPIPLIEKIIASVPLIAVAIGYTILMVNHIKFLNNIKKKKGNES